MKVICSHAASCDRNECKHAWPHEKTIDCGYDFCSRKSTYVMCVPDAKQETPNEKKGFSCIELDNPNVGQTGVVVVQRNNLYPNRWLPQILLPA